MAAISAKFSVERTKQSRISAIDFSDLPFGTIFSDHMLFAEYRNGCWSEPKIKSHGPLTLAPHKAQCFHSSCDFFGREAAWNSG